MLNSLKKNKKGTVLFTVIIVMMVLITVVMSTFVVAVAMQKKAVKNYLDSQSYITAKSMVDAYVKCLTFDDAAADPTAAANSLQMRKALAKMSDDPTDADSLQHIMYYFDGVGGASPLVAATEGMGQVTEFMVKRLNTRTYQVSAVVTDGVYNTVTGLYTDARSSTRVTATLTIKSKADAGLFDNAMITKGDGATLNSATQIYGGYVDANPTGTAAFVTGSSRVIGTFYCAKDLNLVNGSNKHLFLGQKNIFNTTTNQFETDREYLHCAGTMKTSGLEIHNTSNTTGDDAPYLLVDGDLKIGYEGGGTNNTTVGSGASKTMNVYVGGNAYLDNVTLWGNVYCEGNVQLRKNVDLNSFSIYCNGSLTYHGDADAAARTITKAGSIPANVSFPDGGKDYKPTKYPDVDAFLSSNYDRNGDGTADYDPDYDYWSASGTPGVNLQAIANGTAVPYTNFLGTPIVSNVRLAHSDGTVAHMEMSAGHKITVQPNGSDIWIATPRQITFYGGSEIIIDNSMNTLETVTDPVTGLKRQNWKYNVYLYTPGGAAITCNGNNSIGYPGGFPAYSGAVHYMGTNPPSGKDIDAPSNFYWLVDGGQDIELNGASVFGYIYAPKRKLTNNSNLGNLTNSYYDKELMPNGGSYYESSNFKPLVIGSIIANISRVNSDSGSIYVQPSSSIFSNNTTSALENMDWTMKSYSNSKVE